ncbi:MAG TPA: hypothetical protein V6C91_08930 [Coleofasciculaceae cyanobacterium]
MTAAIFYIVFHIFDNASACLFLMLVGHMPVNLTNGESARVGSV